MSIRPEASNAARAQRGGFTLIETVIAIGLLTLLMGGIYQFYNTALRTREVGRSSTQQALLARVILDQLAEEIRQSASQGFDAAVKGTRREIEILSAGLPSRRVSDIRSVIDGQLPGEHDIRRIRYLLYSDEDNTDAEGNPIIYGLVRFEEKTLNSIALHRGEEDADSDTGSGSEEDAFSVKLYAPQIKYLEFRYSDGSSDRWLKTWEGELANTIPQAVRITVGFVPEPEVVDELEDESNIYSAEDEDLDTPYPDRYTVEVRLPAASPPLGSVLLRGRSSRGLGSS